MANEKYTESLTLREMKCHPGKNDFGHVFPQGDVADLDKVKEQLKKAGGKPKLCELNDFLSKPKGQGKPEYIITFNDNSKIIIVVECKRSASNHETETKNKPAGYAVDGVLYYAKFLKEDYNVIAVAISGTSKENMKVSTFHWQKGQDNFHELEKGKDVILEPKNYINIIEGKKIEKSYSSDKIKTTAIQMHEYLREIRMVERHKPIFIAGILIALKNEDFGKTYSALPSYDLVLENLENAIKKVLVKNNIKTNIIDFIQQAFQSLNANTKFKSIELGHNKSITWYIRELETQIKPMMEHSGSTVDALGVFYHEFIKYSGGDGKGLGIVLTPQHLTEFMCELAGVNKKSKVVDICCGTSSFLITAMAKMFKSANDNEIENIKSKQLYGVEFDYELYSLSIANMIIRGDGRSNIYHGDCFEKKNFNALKKEGLNVGLINPPYAQSDNVELEFLEQLLNLLVVGGIGVCVVPMSCAIGTKFKQVRERLFKHHTLKAVFSMPDDIFYPEGTVTCVMVWEAHRQHDSTEETFFGYYKKDGFEKRKKLGRIDKNNTWNEKKHYWISLYKNRKEKPGISVNHCVNFNDEWCAEAYIATDYEKITPENFKKVVKDYVLFNIMNRDDDEEQK